MTSNAGVFHVLRFANHPHAFADHQLWRI